MRERILRKIRAYRSHIRTCVTVEGVSQVALAAAGLVLLSLAIDYYQHLGRLARVFSLLLGLGAIAYAAYRRIFAKLVRPMDDERVALTVEDKFPELRDRLISSLQFANALETGSVGRTDQSLGMMAAVTTDAVAVFEPLDLRRTIDHRRVFRALTGVIAAAVALVALSFVTVQDVNLLSRWFQRNVLLMNIPWPQQTHLAVLCKKVVPKGDALTVTVRASGTLLPSAVKIQYWFAGGRKGEETLARVGELSEYKFEAKFKNVVEPLEFKVYGGDAETETFSVGLVERPTITQLKFWAVYPDYTRMPPRQLFSSESFLEVLPGTTIRVAATASKPLTRAWLAVGDEESSALMFRLDDRKQDAQGADKEPWQLQGFWRSRDADGNVTKDAWGGPNAWVGALKVAEDCSISVKALDDADLDNRPPTRFTVKILADKEPSVTLKLKGIGEMITPKAVIPLDIKATDDFGIRGLAIKHKFMIEDKYADEEELPFKVVGEKEAEQALNWRVEGLGLQPGSVFIFRAEATDYKEPPNVGKTDNLSLRVVTPDELMADLVRRQIEQRQDFLRNRDRQRDEVKIEIDAAVRDIRSKGKTDDPQKGRLTGVEQSLRHAIEEVKHVADVLEQVHLEMLNNGLGDEDERSRLKSAIIEPTRRIVDKMMPELADGLKAALAGDDALLGRQMPGLQAKDDEILAQMDLVLNNMLKMETFRRIVETVRKLKEDQHDLTTDIEKEQKALLDSIH